MLTDLIGPLLLRASETLGSEIRTEVEHDEYLVAQLDAIRTFVAEVGAMWPTLIASLEEQNQIYWNAIEAVADPPIESPQGLAAALAEAERVLVRLVRDRHDAGAALDLARLRSAMRDAAELQERMINDARATPGIRDVRRT